METEELLEKVKQLEERVEKLEKFKNEIESGNIVFDCNDEAEVVLNCGGAE